MSIKVVIVSGGSAVGKTSVLKHLIPVIKAHSSPCFCKIDCLHTDDHIDIKELDIPVVVGLSQDICPDHYLVSNMEELIDWTIGKNSNLLLLETAGLCHRCCPATQKTISVCVVDCIASSKAPQKLGPMLTTADIIVITKIDMVSQAEREIMTMMVKACNTAAKIIPIDAISGYGIAVLNDCIINSNALDDYADDTLRYTMPGGVCSYCIGEQRIGKCYQQGIVEKIDLRDNICSK